MKHRLRGTVAAVPAAPVLLAQTPAPPQFADAVGPGLKFFTERQFATLRRVCQVIADPHARTPEALDRLLRDSPESRQRLYVSGLDTLEFQSQATFYKPFARTTAKESESLLAPLLQPWIYVPPSTLVEFLRAAKQDIRRAAMPGHCVFEAAHPSLKEIDASVPSRPSLVSSPAMA